MASKSQNCSKLELIGKKGFSFRYLWSQIQWNQLKYPMHQNLCYTVLSTCNQAKNIKDVGKGISKAVSEFPSCITHFMVLVVHLICVIVRYS